MGMTKYAIRKLPQAAPTAVFSIAHGLATVFVASAVLMACSGVADVTVAHRADGAAQRPDTSPADEPDAGSLADAAAWDVSVPTDAYRPDSSAGPIHPFTGTTRSRLSYYAVPHPDDEFQSWSLIENDAQTYPVIITMTRGEATGYCAKSGYKGYQPSLGELPPGNDPTYRSKSCKQNRIGSTLAFYQAMAAVDPTLGPMPTTQTMLLGGPLPPGTPGYGCAVSSKTIEVWTGRNMALVFLDLGDGNLSSCEVQWAVSQVRRMRGTSALPNLAEHRLVAAGFRNKSNPNCYVYDHPDHRVVHQAIWNTNFMLPGGQYGRTCTTDPDHSLVRNVQQIQALRMNGDMRVGAFQRIYGWLKAKPWPAGTEFASLMSTRQAFWRRF